MSVGRNLGLRLRRENETRRVPAAELSDLVTKHVQTGACHALCIGLHQESSPFERARSRASHIKHASYIVFGMVKNAKKLGNYLRAGREGKGLTLRAVEEATGISNAYLSQVEGGKIKNPSPVDLRKLCELYDLEYALAMEYAGYPLPEGMATSTPQ